MAKSIIFSTEQVQAYQAGALTSFVVPMKLQPNNRATEIIPSKKWKEYDFIARFQYLDEMPLERYEVTNMYKTPYQPGQKVAIREAWWSGYVLDENDNIPDDATLEYWYRADTKDARPGDMSDSYCFHLWGNNKECWPRWRPASTMPISAARYHPEVVEVKAVRDNGKWFWLITIKNEFICNE